MRLRYAFTHQTSDVYQIRKSEKMACFISGGVEWKCSSVFFFFSVIYQGVDCSVNKLLKIHLSSVYNDL